MDRARRRLLLACGALGPPLFVATFLIEGATRPGYDPRRFPISSLALGERGWRQRLNFLMAGAALLALARGARPGWESRLLSVAGVGLGGAGLFTTDPIFGYPTDGPLLLAQESRTGRLHDFTSLLFFVGVPGATCNAWWHSRKAGARAWGSYSLLSGVVMLATFVLAGAGFTQHPRFVANAGVAQRLSVTTGLAWVTLSAVRLLRSDRA